MPVLIALIILLFSAQRVEATDGSLTSVNAYRKAHGSSVLVSNKYLCEKAMKRAKYIVNSGDWSHNGFYVEAKQKDRQFRVLGENLAKDIDDADLVSRWSQSPTHNEIMLRKGFRYGCVRRYGNIVVFWLGSN